MKIITVQANRGGADAAAQTIIYILGLIGCAVEGLGHLTITYDELARQATLECNEPPLMLYFFRSGQKALRPHLGRLSKTREIAGYHIHPMVKESIPDYDCYSICHPTV